jgi:arsenate reductase
MNDEALVLAYAGCSTCKKALAWLDSQKIPYQVRPIVERPPTRDELAAWIPASGLPVRKWLNTSGQSFRALGKAKIDAASDAELVDWLAADGKLVKRPVLVLGGASRASGASARGAKNRALRVLVGFKEDAWSDRACAVE